jgi:hypothetical protein
MGVHVGVGIGACRHSYVVGENEYNLFVVQKNTDAVAREEERKLDVTGLFHVGDLINCVRTGSLVMRTPDGLGAGAGAAADMTDAAAAAAAAASTSSAVFVTLMGMIGVVTSLSPATHALLKRAQDNLTRVVHGVGGWDHAAYAHTHRECACECVCVCVCVYVSVCACASLCLGPWCGRGGAPRWRAYRTEQRHADAVNVIDGDLVERFLALPPHVAAAVVRGDQGGQPLGVSVDALTKTIEELARLH